MFKPDEFVITSIFQCWWHFIRILGSALAPEYYG